MGFQDVELPCDWTVNRRPTQTGSGDGQKQRTGKKRASDGARRAEEARPEEEEAPDAGAMMMTLREAVEEEETTVRQMILPHPLGPLTSRAPSADAPPRSAREEERMGDDGACPFAHHNSRAGEEGGVRQMILKQLRGGGGSSAGCALAYRPEPIDTEGLLSRLPYKKMLSDMFGGSLRGNMHTPTIPYVTRAYEEAFMREPMHAHERECARGKQCECMFVDRSQPFVGVEFLLPGEAQPRTPHLCVLCCRATTQQLYYDVMFDKMDFPGCIQRYGNIHSEPGEYALDAMLIAVQTAPVHVMPLPIVSHQRNRYAVHVSGGIKHLKQSRVHFQFTPSCSAGSGR